MPACWSCICLEICNINLIKNAVKALADAHEFIFTGKFTHKMTRIK
jgi:hypothetical protein